MMRALCRLACGLSLLAAALAGCDETRLRVVQTHYDLFFPEGSLQVDAFEQKAAAKIDILWVVDNSGTMQDEQENLASNFDAFISIIEESDVDYQVGVISTDMDLASHQGHLQGSPSIIVRGPDAAGQFAANVQVGTTGAGNEQGLLAAHTALTEPVLSEHNKGFLRDDAALALIFVSDEDDHSFGQVSFFRRVFEQMKGVGNENRVIAAAIVGDAPSDQHPEGGCYNPDTGSASFGRRYLELVQGVGGSIGSICAEDFSHTLEQLGLTVAGLSRKFTLSDESPEVSSITVTVDGREIEQDYQEGWIFENGSVFFNGTNVPPPGSHIEVSYLHPQRTFVLSQEPAYNPDAPGDGIKVVVYPSDAPDCTRNADCGTSGSCGLAGKCGGEQIPYSLAEGWVLETRATGEGTEYLVAFERAYFPPGGSTVQVEYACAGGCHGP